MEPEHQYSLWNQDFLETSNLSPKEIDNRIKIAFPDVFAWNSFSEVINSKRYKTYIKMLTTEDALSMARLQGELKAYEAIMRLKD